MWKLFKKHIFVVTLIAIAIVSHREWFNPFSILQSGDWRYRFDEQVVQHLLGWNTWIPFDGLGAANIQIYSFPIRGLAWPLLVMMGVNYDFAVKLTLLIPIAIGGALLPYFLALKLTKDKLISFVAALFYYSTTYFLIIQTRHLYIAAAYALLPGIFLIFSRALKNKHFGPWLALAAILTLGFIYELRIMYIAAFILIGFVAYKVYVGDINKSNVASLIKPGVLAGLVLIMLNLFWILPTLMGSTENFAATTGRGLFGNQLFNINEAFTIFRWSWTGGEEGRAFTVQPIGIYLWFMPAIAFLGMLIGIIKRQKIVIFFGFVALLGILLTKQSAEPFPGLYQWLYGNMPGFSLFREASKFYVITAFGYLGLIAIGLLGLKNSGKQYRVVFAAAIAAVLMVASLNLKPFVTQEFKALTVTSSVPEHYRTLKDILKSEGNFARTFWVPTDARWGYSLSTLPKAAANTLANAEWAAFSEGENGFGGEENKMTKLLNLPFLDELMDRSAMKYLIVPARELDPHDDFYNSYGDKSIYMAIADKLPFLKRTHTEIPEIGLYKNEDIKDYFWTLTNLHSYESVNEFKDNYAFVKGVMKGDFDFIIDPSGGYKAATNVKGLFRNIDESSATHEDTIDRIPGKEERAILKTNPQRFYYTINGESLEIGKAAMDYSLTGLSSEVSGNTNRTPLSVVQMSPQQDYYLKMDDHLTSIAAAKGKDSQTLSSQTNEISSYSSDRINLIPNANLSSGTWQKQVEDCSSQKNDPALLSMNVQSRKDNPALNALQLEAGSHIACTGPPDVAVLPGQEYLFSFEYKAINATFAGYSIRFDDPTQTEISDRLPVSQSEWRTLIRGVAVPPGAHKAKIQFYAYHPINESRSLETVVNLYSNFKMAPLKLLAQHQLESPKYAQFPLTGALKEQKISYQDRSLTTNNLVPNPSFELGPWQDVGSPGTELEFAL